MPHEKQVIPILLWSVARTGSWST